MGRAAKTAGRGERRSRNFNTTVGLQVSKGEIEDESHDVLRDGIGSKQLHAEDNLPLEDPTNNRALKPTDDGKEEPFTVHTVPRMIHFLGAGNVGNFVAHSLAGIPNPPPITLLLRKQALQQWRANGGKIQIIAGGVGEERTGFEVERLWNTRRHGHDDFEDTTIWNLIVSVKGYATVPALMSIRSRLTHNSTIVFLQNGAGILDEVNEKVFPDIEERPNYIIGLVSHGVKSQKPSDRFQVIHAGNGTIALGLLPKHPDQQYEKGTDNFFPPTARYMLRTITRTHVLCAVGFSPNEILQLQLEKLAVNALINPLTAILGCNNGGLLNNLAITHTVRLLLSEISLVIRLLPELKNVLNVNLRFSPAKLENLMMRVAQRTSENSSSMLQDVSFGQRTEIDYINGYIVKRGQEVGVRCVMNYMLMQMVKAKRQMTMDEVKDYLPMIRETSRPRGS